MEKLVMEMTYELESITIIAKNNKPQLKKIDPQTTIHPFLVTKEPFYYNIQLNYELIEEYLG